MHLLRDIRLKTVVLAATSLTVLSIATSLVAYPTPATVPYRWELAFEPGPLRLYVDSASDSGVYWYFTYKITNRTGRDQVWAPSLTLFTDSGEIMNSGRDVPARVVDAIDALLGNDLLETQNEIIGDIHHGKEHAKEGIAVWPAKSTDVNELSLFIAGISGETARITNPVTNEDVLLRKTLQRDYLIRGDALARGSKPAELVRQEWILR